MATSFMTLGCAIFVFSIISTNFSATEAKRKNVYYDFQPQRLNSNPSPQQQRQSMAPRETNTCEERQTSGPICESCELLSTCVRHSNGWVNIPVEMCDSENGYYCNSRLGMCSNTTGPCHPLEGNFQCTSLGIFPDPYDCQEYHVCHFIGTTIVAATLKCDGDKAFNAATGQCSLTLQHEICEPNQFECQNAGDAYPWPTNPNIFYICKATSKDDERVLYPSLYRCADGEIFDGYFCKPGSFIPTIPTNAPSSSPTSDPNDPMATSSTTTIPIQRCSESGLIADTEDCHRYYYCSAVNGISKHLECPQGTYYNAALSACTMGSC